MAILTRSVLCIVLPALGGWANAAQRQRDLRLQPNLKEVKEWPATARRWALIVGVEQYDDPQVARVPGAANDAEAFAKGLTDNAGFPPDQVVVLTRHQLSTRLHPTRANILREFSNFTRRVPKDGLLLFAFAGHGIERRGQAFLVPSDSFPADDIKLLEDTAISVNRIRSWIRATAVKQVLLVLDACRNDPTAARGEAPNLLTEAYRSFSYDEANKEVEAFATLYATAVGERAYEYTDSKTGRVRGYFTAALVEGLAGKAADSRGEVTLARLILYVQQTVPGRVASEIGAAYKQQPFAEIHGYKANELIVARTPPPPEPVVAAAPPTPAPTPVPAPAPRTTAPPRYTGPSSGRLIWAGHLPPSGALTIGERTPSTGAVLGTPLPGVPVKIRVHPAGLSADGLTIYTAESAKGPEQPSRHNGWQRTQYVTDNRQAREVSVTESPGSGNQWQRLAVRAGSRDLSVIVIDWEVQGDQRD